MSARRIRAEGEGTRARAQTRRGAMVFQQLKALEGSCEVRVESFLDRDKRFKWRVTVTPRHDSMHPIIAEADTDRDAARAAVGRAAVRGLLTKSVLP